MYKNVPVLDSGARGATTTFVQRGIGDVLIAWENEAFLAVKELGKDKLEIVIPSYSILAEPPVAVVDKVANKHGTAECGDSVSAIHVLRRRRRRSRLATTTVRASKSIADKYAGQFPKLNLFTVNDVFGGWQNAQKTHFADGGIFDQIYGK